MLAIGDIELTELLSDDGYNSSVHLVNMRELNWNSLTDYFKPLDGQFLLELLAFMPTGWNFRPKQGQSPSLPLNFTMSDLEKIVRFDKDSFMQSPL